MWDSIALRQPRSIRFHLSLVFFFSLLLVAILGFFSIWRLSDLNRVSADIRDHWLKTTRLLGDLNNFTSDFRAVEGENLLSSTTSEATESEKELAELDQSVSETQLKYEQMQHDTAENDLYLQFKANWQEYKKIVVQEHSLWPAGRKAEAITMYRTTSRSAYSAASDALELLTQSNVAKGLEAGSRADAAYRQAQWLMAIAMAVAGAMVAAALIYVQRAISDPLLYLADCMHRLADNYTNVEVPGTKRRDEIGHMARAVVVFRSNAVELMLSQRGLAQQASMLKEKLEHEQRLTQLQRNFVSMASHEFRTPFNIIDGQAQRLISMNERLQPADIAKRASKIRGAVSRMTHLLDKLLESSRLVDGDTGLYFHPMKLDLIKTLHDVCNLHREISPSTQIRENYDAPQLQIVGDGKLLFQAFDNLLSNAIKYSAPGSVINIRAWIDVGQAFVAVKDHGCGIPENDLAQLFTCYYRGSNVSGIVGTGVGLYLVKMVIELHSGDILVESKEGKGSLFTVRIPSSVSASEVDLAAV
jgi:two-component system, OmpR family, sensor kinase